MATATAHDGTDGSIHGGEFAGCAPCHGVTQYWQVRSGTPDPNGSSRLLWDGYDLAEAEQVQARHADSYLVREDWKNGRLLGTARFD